MYMYSLDPGWNVGVLMTGLCKTAQECAFVPVALTRLEIDDHLSIPSPAVPDSIELHDL